MAVLEDVPEDEKDWHPGSDGRVLDLVHPSLYPVVYGRTTDREGDVIEAPSGGCRFDSDHFQWLPSEFEVDPAGTNVTIQSPYINNLHPTKHVKMYQVIQNILQCALPLFKRVLSDLVRPASEIPVRLRINEGGDVGCIWDCEQPYPESPDEEPEDMDRWLDSQEQQLPESKPEYDGSWERMTWPPITFEDNTLQVIVKLANIVLTPEKPEYEGGKWHVEGVLVLQALKRCVIDVVCQECAMRRSLPRSSMYVCRCFLSLASHEPELQYYAAENITESRLAFRNAIGPPTYHQQDDGYCMQKLYGMDRSNFLRFSTASTHNTSMAGMITVRKKLAAS